MAHLHQWVKGTHHNNQRTKRTRSCNTSKTKSNTLPWYNTQQTRERKKLPQHNKSHIWQLYSWVHTQWIVRKWNIFFFKPRARKGLPFSSLVLNTIPEFLLRANKQENRRQLNQNLSGDEMCIWKVFRISHKYLLERTKKFTQFSWYKNCHKNLSYVYIVKKHESKTYESNSGFNALKK